MIKIKTMGSKDKPEVRRPVPGLWYHGVNHDGSVGALASCWWVATAGAGWSATYGGDDKILDMSRYAHLEEHPAK